MQVQSDEQLRSEAGQQPHINGQHVIRRADELRMHPSDGRHGLAVSSAVPSQPFNPTAMSRSDWRQVVRSPGQLRLHAALEALGWTGVIDDFNDAARLKNQSIPQPILITTNGTIVAGFGNWRLAMLEGRHEINCIEYPLSEDEALQFILTHHQTRCGWNDFVRIRLALTLEPNLQQRGLDNMRAGGKCKGSANLSGADRIDVREKIARRAGTGTGNVGKVKAILRSAHPNIITALQNGLLSIHRAWLWTKLPKLQQRVEFGRYEEERTQRKILHVFLPKPASGSLDPAHVIESIQRLEARQPGSIAIRTSRRLRRTVVILGQDFSMLPGAQKELD
jgi:hypothetical protein